MMQLCDDASRGFLLDDIDVAIGAAASSGCLRVALSMPRILVRTAYHSRT